MRSVIVPCEWFQSVEIPLHLTILQGECHHNQISSSAVFD